jgi:NAD(P)H-hydrate epimerase
VVVLAGRGNNGGDGLGLARHLRNSGAEVRAYLCGGDRGLPPEAGANLEAWRASGGHLALPRQPEFWARLEEDLADWATLVVDALLGVGLTGAPHGDLARAISVLGDVGRRGQSPHVLALDLPSGLDADTGSLWEPHVVADTTVTFGLPKVGLFVHPGAAAAGEVVLADIGLPGATVDGPTGASRPTWLWDAASAARFLLPRPPEAHKGDAGRVLAICGSLGATGAAVLAGEAAVRIGAGLVTVATAAGQQQVIAAALREAMSAQLAEDGEGRLAVGALEAALRLADGADAVALGPGLGRTEGVAEFVRGFVRRCPRPLVLDADGINAFAGRAGELGARAAGRSSPPPLILTPHPGELGRLLGLSASEVQADRLAVARRAAEQTGAIVLLKGAGTVIAAPGGEAWVVPSGNPGMATGGSGDVLTGAVVGLWAQVAAECARGRRAADPALHGPSLAATAALLHGLAGDLAALDLGEVGIQARDLVERLPRARRLALDASEAPPALARSLHGVVAVV